MILNKEVFRDEVIDHVTKYQTSYIDAILHKLREHGLEPEDAPKLIDKAMTSRIESEGIQLNMLIGDHNNESRL